MNDIWSCARVQLQNPPIQRALNNWFHNVVRWRAQLIINCRVSRREDAYRRSALFNKQRPPNELISRLIKTPRGLNTSQESSRTNYGAPSASQSHHITIKKTSICKEKKHSDESNFYQKNHQIRIKIKSLWRESE